MTQADVLVAPTPRVPHLVAQKLYVGLEATSATVLACEKGRGHRWTGIIVTFEHEGLGEVPVTFCARCFVRQCGFDVTKDPGSVCLLPIHHRNLHRDHAGKWRELGK
jgi:hypothetical protein